MDNYTLLRLASREDEDAPDPDEQIPSPYPDKKAETAADFKRRYKEFYTDIKTDIREDW